MPDYSADSVPSHPMELKGNSAEGNPVTMNGFGKYADFARPTGPDGVAHENATDAMGAFIQGKSATEQSL